ncbi:hypothetical protein EJB05_46861, partial [Eragrostis curvula]
MTRRASTPPLRRPLLPLRRGGRAPRRPPRFDVEGALARTEMDDDVEESSSKHREHILAFRSAANVSTASAPPPAPAPSLLPDPDLAGDQPVPRIPTSPLRLLHQPLLLLWRQQSHLFPQAQESSGLLRPTFCTGSASAKLQGFVWSLLHGLLNQVHTEAYLNSLKSSFRVAVIVEVPPAALIPNWIVERKLLCPFRGWFNFIAAKLAL